MPKVTYEKLFTAKILGKLVSLVADGPYVKCIPEPPNIFECARRHRQLLLHGKVQDERPTHSKTEGTDMVKRSS